MTITADDASPSGTQEWRRIGPSTVTRATALISTRSCYYVEPLSADLTRRSGNVTVPVFFVTVGAVMIGIGVRQLQVGNERIVGKRFEFEDFAVVGARWTVEGLCAGSQPRR